MAGATGSGHRQSTIEDALAKLVRRPVPIVGAGRTDAGVNARTMVAHLDLPDGFPADDRLCVASTQSAGAT